MFPLPSVEIIELPFTLMLSTSRLPSIVTPPSTSIALASQILTTSSSFTNLEPLDPSTSKSNDVEEIPIARVDARVIPVPSGARMMSELVSIEDIVLPSIRMLSQSNWPVTDVVPVTLKSLLNVVTPVTPNVPPMVTAPEVEIVSVETEESPKLIVTPPVVTVSLYSSLELDISLR